MTTEPLRDLCDGLEHCPNPQACSVCREEPERMAKVVYRCPECRKEWTTEDDPNEWAYGHDCEAE